MLRSTKAGGEGAEVGGEGGFPGHDGDRGGSGSGHGTGGGGAWSGAGAGGFGVRGWREVGLGFPCRRRVGEVWFGHFAVFATKVLKKGKVL